MSPEAIASMVCLAWARPIWDATWVCFEMVGCNIFSHCHEHGQTFQVDFNSGSFFLSPAFALDALEATYFQGHVGDHEAGTEH